MLGPIKKTKFIPENIFEARPSLAFHFIFDELSAPSRSKMAAVLAKSTKIEDLPGGSNS